MIRTIDYLALSIGAALIAYALSSTLAAQINPILAHVAHLTM